VTARVDCFRPKSTRLCRQPLPRVATQRRSRYASVMTYPTSPSKRALLKRRCKEIFGGSIGASELLRGRSKNEDFWPRACETRGGGTLIKNLAMLKHNKVYLRCFNVAKIRRSIARGVKRPPMVAMI